jgi:hypothetical protein
MHLIGSLRLEEFPVGGGNKLKVSLGIRDLAA